MAAKDDLLGAVQGLTEDRARVLLGWLGMDARRTASTGERPGESDEQTLGPLGDALGITGEVREPGYSRLRLDVDGAFFNPNGVLHGGVIYTMIDYSMGGAVQVGLPEGEFCATIEAKVSYLASVREGVLHAETRVLRQGRNIAFTETKVTDDKERLVATATGSLFIFRAQS